MMAALDRLWLVAESIHVKRMPPGHLPSSMLCKCNRALSTGAGALLSGSVTALVEVLPVELVFIRGCWSQ